MSIDKKSAIETSGGNKIWRRDNIIYYLMLTPVDEEEAIQLSGEGAKLIDEGLVVRVLINLKQTTQFSSEARKIWVKFLQNPKIEKTAIFGGNVFVRTLASFVIAASQKKNIKFFATEKEASEWLEE